MNALQVTILVVVVAAVAVFISKSITCIPFLQTCIIH